MNRSCQVLLSLPPASVASFDQVSRNLPEGVFAASDPAGSKLGSGGGWAHLLIEAWRASGSPDLWEWLRRELRLVIHSGGESRRCPAYASEGKVFTPMPILRWSWGQRLDQTLFDLQRSFLDNVVQAAPEDTVAGVCSGDVLLRGDVPTLLPRADVTCFGVWASPETASRHGVFFCDPAAPERLLFMRQKPSPGEIREASRRSVFLVDSGLWLFSARAVAVLLAACGWEGSDFASGGARFFDLYTTFGMALGEHPSQPDEAISSLSVAVVPIRDGAFYHFGGSRELIRSTLALQNAALDQARHHCTMPKHPAVFIQNADVGVGLHRGNHTVWLENATIPASWELEHGHVVTGVPANGWHVRLPSGTCLDMVPIGDEDWCIRVYGIDDSFRGPVDDPETLWFGKPVSAWFAERGLAWDRLGIEAGTDLQHARLFPVISSRDLAGGFVQWLLGMPDRGRHDHGEQRRWLNRPVEMDGADGEKRRLSEETGRADWGEVYRGCERLSAAELGLRANLLRRERQRAELRRRSLARLAAAPEESVLLRADLGACAELAVAGGLELTDPSPSPQGLAAVRWCMFRSATRRLSGDAGWQDDERQAFSILRERIMAAGGAEPVSPVRHLLEDQIIWGRSPIRLDLAGGWTDTPPYCMIHGGRVLALAAELNGQPPIQVFGRCIDTPEIVLRSIDLGQHERVTTFEQLRDFTHVGGSFSIPKAALALAGFLPEFSIHGATTLREQLERFGGGIELTLLAAIPKGSGLGTSSILAASVLGTLGDLCALDWDSQAVLLRTLVLEQLLTTGGGWQDQAGGVLPGVKMLESNPGDRQDILVRWLPDRVLRHHLNTTVFLYYTGITRVAKGILQDVVRGMFLNAASSLNIIERIGANAERMADALQRQDWPAICAGIRRSWELNCALDKGTDPPEIRALLARIEDWLAGAKLLGAGGGGYLFLVAKDEEAGARLRRELEVNPPNAMARFVDLSLSDTGLQITRS